LLEKGIRPAVTPLTKIKVPGEIYAWKASENDRDQAKDVQKKNREQFLTAFAQDQAVLAYERDASGKGTFLLGNWDENWSYASTTS